MIHLFRKRWLSIIMLSIVYLLNVHTSYGVEYLRYTVSGDVCIFSLEIKNNADTPDLYYRIGNGTWKQMTAATNVAVSGNFIEFKAGSNGNTTFCNRKIVVKGGSNVAVSGNIMTLLDASGTLKTINTKCCFAEFFKNCKCLTSVSGNLLPATKLSDSCYADMFAGCTSLTSVPQNLLPATNLVKGCYAGMFKDCSSLKNIVTLPATSLATQCYYRMFENCSMLTNISSNALPAMTLAPCCYASMFSGCTNITMLPKNLLPATILSPECYLEMFRGCKKLSSVPSDLLHSMTLKNGCYRFMFGECSSLRNAPELPANQLYEDCYRGIFYDCVLLENAPELKSTILAKSCYAWMFCGCENLKKVQDVLPATTLAENCYERMYAYCYSLVKAPELPATELQKWCYMLMFDHCTSLKKAPKLMAKTLVYGCYVSMFGSCMNLTEIEVAFDKWSEDATYWTSYGTYDTKSPLIPTSGWTYNVAKKGTFICPIALSKEYNNESELYYDKIPLGWTCGLKISFDNGGLGNGSIAEKLTGTGKLVLTGEKYTSDGLIQVGWSTVKNSRNAEYNLTGTYYLNESTTLYPVWRPLNSNLEQPLRFVAKEAGSTVMLKKNGTDWQEPQLEYSTDGGITWKDYAYGTTITLKSIDDKVLFCAKDKNEHFSLSLSKYIQCVMTGKIYAGGNMMTLIHRYGATNEIPNAYCFAKFFSQCESLIQVVGNNFMPATTLKERCYYMTFSECSKLTNVPKSLLPAMEMQKECYNTMFGRCSSLQVAPDLPATQLASVCYWGMFQSCSKLQQIEVGFVDWADDLNATKQWMSSVHKTGTFIAPNLTIMKHGYNYNPWPPFTVTYHLDEYCVSGANTCVKQTNNEGVFDIYPFEFKRPGYVCVGWALSKNGKKKYAYNRTDVSISEDIDLYPVYEKLYDYVCFSLRTGSASVWLQRGNGVADSWTGPSVEYSNDGCRTWTTCKYDKTPISVTKENPVYFRAKGTNSYFSKSKTQYVLFGYAGTAESLVVSGNIMTLLNKEGIGNVVSDYCFYCLFTTQNAGQEDYVLYSAKDLKLPATTLGKYCYEYMFATNERLKYSPMELPADTTKESCYANMFYNCYNLEESPNICATKLTNSCMNNMFAAYKQAIKLNKIKVHFTTWNANATQNWVYGSFSKNGTFYAPESLQYKNGNHYIPKEWKMVKNTNSCNCNKEKFYSLIDEDRIIDFEQFEHNENLLVELYPMPISNYMNIKSNYEVVAVSIYTMDGAKAISEKNSTRIDVTGLKSGNYIVEIETLNGIEKKQVVIAR